MQNNLEHRIFFETRESWPNIRVTCSCGLLDSGWITLWEVDEWIDDHLD